MIIDELIFDRTADDVERVKVLKDQIMSEGLDSLTPSEKAEYLAGMKGAYNATDMNRVGTAVQYIAQRMIQLPVDLQTYRENNGVGEDHIFDLPYDTADIVVSPKTDWSVSDIPTVTQIKTYLGNISNLRSILTLPSGTPSSPSTLNGMTYTTANNLERILWVVYQALLQVESEAYDLIDRAILDRWHSDEFYANEI